MSKLVKILLVALFLVGITLPAFAAVENVKVGGTLTIKGIYRTNFDVYDIPVPVIDLDAAHNFYTGASVYVSADLTNKVSAMIQLINERDWDTTTFINDVNSFNLDKAYIKIADLMTPGLDLTIGRQDIKLGEGLVMGSAYTIPFFAFPFTPKPNVYVGGVPIRNFDLGMQKSFDAIKIDYNFATAPVSISAFMSKLLDVYTPSSLPISDADVYGISLKWAPENVEVEPYIIDGRMPQGDVAPLPEDFSLLTYGIRAAGTPAAVPGLSLKGEIAAQAGNDVLDLDFEGWAGYLGVAYEFSAAVKPTVSLGYNYYTGDDLTTAEWENWVPVFPDNVADRIGSIGYTLAYQEFLSVFNPFLRGESNMAVWKIGLGIQPTEKLGISLNYFNLTAVETVGAIDTAIGGEADLAFNYAYTEDLGMGLEIGYFVPGSMWDDIVAIDTSNVWQAIATVKVAF